MAATSIGVVPQAGKRLTAEQKLAKVSHDGQKLDYANELKLSSEEDAPMTMAVDRKVGDLFAREPGDGGANSGQGKNLVTGVNASQSSIEGGSNDHARLYSFKDNE